MSKQCPVCNSIFEQGSRQWANKIYCDQKCRKLAYRKNKSQSLRIQQRRANMRQNEETLYLVRQCKNAGTVQILTGHTLDSFVETMRLVRGRPKGDVVLCHIAPVKGKKFTGLFHCKNLFYGGKFQNNKFGNGYIGGGLYIRNCNLKKVWQVDRGTSTNDVLLKIEKFLGCVISKYLEITPVRKSKKYQIIEKIVMLEGGGDHEGMMAVSYNNLLERLGRLQKRLVCKVSHHHESKFLAYMDGLTRFISYGGERVKMLRRVRASLVIAYMALERVGESNTNNKYFM